MTDTADQYICPGCKRDGISRPGHDYPPACGPPYCWWPFVDCGVCHGIGGLPDPDDMDEEIPCPSCRGMGHRTELRSGINWAALASLEE